MLNFIGFNKKLHFKLQSTYIIAGFSIFLLVVFLLFYIFFITDFILILVTSICLLNYFIVIFLLKYEYYLVAKCLTVLGLIIQVTLLMYVYFSPDAELQYFLFLVAPITFFIFDLDNKLEKYILFFYNIIAIIITIMSAIYTNTTPTIPLTNDVEVLLKIASVTSVTISIFVVFYFYANTLKRVHHQLHFLATTDSLTQISNRRVLFDHGEYLFRHQKNKSKGFTFLLFDIDFFKSINDAYGHPVGDEILIQLTDVIRKNIRTTDILARYGGEEFAVILKDTDPSEGINKAESIRKCIERHHFAVKESLSAHITISIGAVSYSSKYNHFDEMVIEADKALYKAKESGRNQIVVY